MVSRKARAIQHHPPLTCQAIFSSNDGNLRLDASRILLRPKAIASVSILPQVEQSFRDQKCRIVKPLMMKGGYDDLFWYLLPPSSYGCKDEFGRSA
jgi:hypothetical protein